MLFSIMLFCITRVFYQITPSTARGRRGLRNFLFFRVRFRRAAAVWVEARTALSAEGEAESRVGAARFFGFSPTARRGFAIIRGRQFKTLRSTHRFGYRWNVGVQTVRAETERRMRPMGASSFRGSYRASYSLTGTAAGDCALFLLPLMEQGQKEERWEEHQKS